MFKVALFALLCAQAFGRPHEGGIESHIVGGTPVQDGEYPFVVSIRGYDGFYFCSGVLISDRYVLTTAQCAETEMLLRIGVGSIHITEQQLVEVDKYVVYPKTDPHYIENDIALLRLRDPVKVGANITTINFSVNDTLDGRNATAVGWGATYVDAPPSNDLMSLKRRIISNDECSRNHKYPVTHSHVCIQGIVDTGLFCGDSGAALVYKGTDGKNYLAGIATWGQSCPEGYPEVFTRVSSFAQWIKDHMT